MRPMDNTRNGLCGRMCRAPCPLTMGRISGRSLKASSASKTPKQMFLCRRTINGCRQERSWATVILSPGECSTRRRVGASHKDENVYLLSSILQDNAPDRYSLSPKACQGILRRAAKRGKELPQVLREALERQAAQGEAPAASAQARAAQAEATGTAKNARPRCGEENLRASP